MLCHRLLTNVLLVGSLSPGLVDSIFRRSRVIIWEQEKRLALLDFWKTQNQNYVFGYAVPGKTPVPELAAQVAASNDYITVWLRRMHR
jgi:hypothetical protein